MKTSDKDMSRARLEIDLEGLIKNSRFLLNMVGRNDPLDEDYVSHFHYLVNEINADIDVYRFAHSDIKY